MMAPAPSGLATRSARSVVGVTAVVLARGWPTRNELALSRWTFHTVRAVMETSSTGIRCLQGSYQGGLQAARTGMCRDSSRTC